MIRGVAEGVMECFGLVSSGALFVGDVGGGWRDVGE